MGLLKFVSYYKILLFTLLFINILIIICSKRAILGYINIAILLWNYWVLFIKNLEFLDLFIKIYISFTLSLLISWLFGLDKEENIFVYTLYYI